MTAVEIHGGLYIAWQIAYMHYAWGIRHETADADHSADLVQELRTDSQITGSPETHFLLPGPVEI